MVHLRVIAPHEQALEAVELLKHSDVASHLVVLEGVARYPDGDLVLVDVPREEVSIIIGDLKELGIHETGSITVEPIEVQLSARAEAAERRAPGEPGDAVIWEEVEAKTQEQSRLSFSFCIFMVLAGLIGAVGIYLDSAILVVGATVVGPEFGPIAAFCVATIQRRGRLALQSLGALAIGFPLAIAAVWLASIVFKATGVTPQTFTEEDHSLSTSISNPDFFAFFVAFCAGMAGVLSLSTAKSGALIGVLVSVTTLPAAANVGIALAYGDASSRDGSLAQLGLNVAGILVAGILTLLVQRAYFRMRRKEHLREPERAHAGLPVGHRLRPTDPPPEERRDGAASDPSPATTRPRASS